jgi:hypothetical protein
MDFCSRNTKSCLFSAKDIPDFQIKLANEILFNDYNTEYKGMDLVSSFDLQVCQNNAMIFSFYIFSC